MLEQLGRPAIVFALITSMEISMRKLALAAAAAVLFALPLPASAADTGSAGAATELSSQSVRVGPDGVTVRTGHRRWESRRRAHHRHESRRARRHDCRTVKTTIREGGRKIVKRVRRCD
jgi:hypothetical protein